MRDQKDHIIPPLLTTAFRGGAPVRKVHHVPARENFSKGERARYTRAGKVPMGDLASEHGAVGAVSGGTSPLTARPQPPDAPFARRTTRRQTTDALLRGTKRVEATSVLMGSLGAPTVEGPMERGLTPATIRGRPAGSLGGGDLPSPHGGSAEGFRPLPRLPIGRPRPPRRECRTGRRSRWRRGRDRPRPPRRWRQGNGGRGDPVRSFLFFSFVAPAGFV